MSSFQSDARFSIPLKKEMELRDKAAAGDIVWVMTPSTAAPVPTAAAWTRDVVITLETAAGKIHSWFDKSITSGVSIADDSTAGTATIAATTLVIKNGKATVTVSGDEAAWLDTETDTLTVAELTVMGYTVTAKTSVETFTA
jgi:hypothetical protein